MPSEKQIPSPTCAQASTRSRCGHLSDTSIAFCAFFVLATFIMLYVLIWPSNIDAHRSPTRWYLPHARTTYSLDSVWPTVRHHVMSNESSIRAQTRE
ncbi:hypothetical protein BDR05DRAFT_118467 [Suillus weaverae]|nr:hypothetical protein BDR05DRAFT_118467 [Suillus weaverae]